MILRGVQRRNVIAPIEFPRPLRWCYRFSPALFRILSTPLNRRKMGHEQTSRMAGVYRGAVPWLIELIRTGRIR